MIVTAAVIWVWAGLGCKVSLLAPHSFWEAGVYRVVLGK